MCKHCIDAQNLEFIIRYFSSCIGIIHKKEVYYNKQKKSLKKHMVFKGLHKFI